MDKSNQPLSWEPQSEYFSIQSWKFKSRCRKSKWFDSLESFLSPNGTNRDELDRFPKCLCGYYSMVRILTKREKNMINHLLPKDIEEYLGNATRSICSFCSNKWSEENSFCNLYKLGSMKFSSSLFYDILNICLDLDSNLVYQSSYYLLLIGWCESHSQHILSICLL